MPGYYRFIMHIFSKQAVAHNARAQRDALPLTPRPLPRPTCPNIEIIIASVCVQHKYVNWAQWDPNIKQVFVKASIYVNSYSQIIKLHHIKSSYSIKLINKKYNKRIEYLRSSLSETDELPEPVASTCGRIMKAARWNSAKKSKNCKDHRTETDWL